MTENNTISTAATEILLACLAKPHDAIHPTAHRLLEEAFPNHYLLETDHHYFRPWYETELWTLEPLGGEGFDTQWSHEWSVRADRSYGSLYSGWMRAKWSGHELQMLAIGTKGSYCRDVRWFVLAETDEIAEGYFAEVCRLHSTVKGEVLVFQEGHWYADKELFESIQSTNMADLVLHGNLKDEVETDLQLFFEQQETYRKYRIPWKRGVMFLGPPGNGKTHMIKALVNNFKLPCLYVKSFSGQHVSAQQCVARAFERARETAPCLLILEDLDTLLDDENRSYFLNEMDGFASNDGIVTIASCNFPEKLDAAILDRPSRFDRKYHFELPEAVDRRGYLATFMTRFDAELQLDDSGLDAVADATHGYSFAYLKELYVSSVVRWISTERHRAIADVLKEQSESLREQMMTEPPTEESPKQTRRRPHYRSSFMRPFDEDED